MASTKVEARGCSPFTRYALSLQGFSAFGDAEKKTLVGPLRFTPMVCTALVVAGMALQWPVCSVHWLGLHYLGPCSLEETQ